MSEEKKGNDPARWTKLLDGLDERLQLGLLDKLRKAVSHHFEKDTLLIQPASVEDEEYLKKNQVLQQLEVLAQDIVNVEKVKIAPAEK